MRSAHPCKIDSSRLCILQKLSFLRFCIFRCRELIQAGLASAVERAKLELRAFEGEGVILVAGSLHAAAEAIRAAAAGGR